MLNDCNYNIIKVLHDLSSIYWFLKKHGLMDAKISGDTYNYKILEDLKKDVEKHLKIICDDVKIGNEFIK